MNEVMCQIRALHVLHILCIWDEATGQETTATCSNLLTITHGSKHWSESGETLGCNSAPLTPGAWLGASLRSILPLVNYIHRHSNAT